MPAEYQGKGACLLDAVRIQRAVGSRSPSLAVATTMHHFSVASLAELTAAGNGFEWAMLTAIAENSWLLSSGFAEGKPGQHILTPAMRGVPADGGITVTGVKKPCSLTWSMNLMSASVAVAGPGTGTGRLAIVLIPAESAGIQRAPFWQTTALAAAESDQVTLTGVFVPDALIFYPHDGESPGRDPGGGQQAGQRIGRVHRLLPGGVPVQGQEDLLGREPIRQPVRGVHRERGLAHPGHPPDRVNPHHPARIRRGRLQLGQLPLPPGERGQVTRQRPGRRRHPARHRPRRRELRLQARCPQLEDPHRLIQVLQPVHPQIRQRRPRQKSSAHQRGRRLRYQHLAPVPGHYWTTPSRRC